MLPTTLPAHPEIVGWRPCSADLGECVYKPPKPVGGGGRRLLDFGGGYADAQGDGDRDGLFGGGRFGFDGRQLAMGEESDEGATWWNAAASSPNPPNPPNPPGHPAAPAGSPPGSADKKLAEEIALFDEVCPGGEVMVNVTAHLDLIEDPVGPLYFVVYASQDFDSWWQASKVDSKTSLFHAEVMPPPPPPPPPLATWLALLTLPPLVPRRR